MERSLEIPSRTPNQSSVPFFSLSLLSEPPMKQVKHGFTLVELLVVITIIGILMGLLIPAVNSARETARRNQCATNMKNLALAAVQHENSKGLMAGYVQDFGLYEAAVDPSDPTNAAVPRHKKIGTWVVAHLPWLDAQPTYEHWTQDRYPIIVADPTNPPNLGSTGAVSGSGEGFHTLAAPNLAIMQCPSDPATLAEFAKNSYVYNNGMMNTNSVVGFVTSQARANGIGNSKYNINASFAPSGQGPSVRLDDLKDGQGFTMLFSENVQALPWHAAGFINSVDLQLTGTDTDIVFDATTTPEVEAARYVHGMVWHYEDLESSNTAFAALWNNNGDATPDVPGAVNSLHRINGGGTTVSDDIFTKRIANIADARNLARPSSAHVDGVNAAFADGATRFVSQSVDYRVYQALMTPRGKSSNVPWPEFVLTDELGE